MELVEETKKLLIETAKDLKGRTRRLFMARTVLALGKGGQRLAERGHFLTRKNRTFRAEVVSVVLEIVPLSS